MNLKGVATKVLVGFLFAGIMSTNGSATPQPRPTAEAFAALPTFSNVAVSTDGTKLAYSVPREDGNLDIVVYTLASRTSVRINLEAKKLRRIQFEEGGQILVTASVTSNDFVEKVELSRVYALDLTTGRARVLFTNGTGMRNLNSGVSLSGLLPNEPNSILISAFDQLSSRGNDTRLGDSTFTLNLYRVALDSDRVVLVGRGNAHTVQWLADQTGQPIARVDLNLVANTNSLWLRGENGEWRNVLELSGTSLQSISALGVSDSGRILFSRDTEDEFGIIESIDPKTDRIATVLRAEGVDLSGIIIDEYTGRMLGVNVGGLTPDTRWTNPKMLEAQTLLEGQYPGKTVSIVDFTPDYKYFVASVSTPSEPPKYHLLNLSGPSISTMGNAMPSLLGVGMGQVRGTTFKSRDGVDIPVYVTTPPGHDSAKNAPTIIFPHGGPASRDVPSFDWWAQFMASRGYVVIQPQFRGSTGFGDSFAEAGERQWGKRMQDDVSDAVAWAVKEGTTDASRVCIVGASYGGYAALAGVTITPDLYKCAISVAGVADLPQMMREERADVGGRRSATVNYWYNHIGADDKSAMEAASPRRLVANVRAPILLIHGKDDTVVKFEQSQIMATALRRANKPHKLIELRGEDHWLSRADTRLQMLREIDAFLAEHLGKGLE